MALYNFCNIVVDVRNKYDYTEKMCRGYEDTSGNEAKFTVEISEEKIEKAYYKERQYELSYHEFLCIYRDICTKMADFNGFLFHASVLALNGDGYIFTARSGTGKSTHSMLWKQYFGDRVAIINGDKPIIRFEDGSFYAYGTPWCGKEGFNVNGRVKVKAVCFLEQAKQNSIAKLTTIDVIRRVFDQVYRPEETKKTERVLELLDKFITDIPFYNLKCNISTEAVQIAYNAMKGN